MRWDSPLHKFSNCGRILIKMWRGKLDKQFFFELFGVLFLDIAGRYKVAYMMSEDYSSLWKINHCDACSSIRVMAGRFI